MKSVIVVHHHEIVLKRNNRAYFERQLTANLRLALAGLGPSFTVRPGYGRSVIEGGESPGEAAPALARLAKVFGVANICAGVKVSQDVAEFCAAADGLLAGSEFRTIRVHTNRADKRFATRSMDVSAQVGEYICTKYGVRADLTTPDETVFIEIADGAAYVYRSKMKGAGGLPVGVSGKIVSLLSAGFDSPVASWQMMRRGGAVIFIHFHSMPYTDARSVDQVRDLVKVLTLWQFRSRLWLVPFAEVQNRIVLGTPQELRVILYRRMMFRIAEAVALREGAEALATGEALGQVASQTLRNIRVINEVATLPVLRPLAGTDKEETMALAREIGTYDISKEPYDDCCSFLAPRKPATWASPEEVRRAEAALDTPELVRMALEAMTVETYPVK